MSSDVAVNAPTEERNSATSGIDEASTLEILQLLNAEDATVPAAVATVLPNLAIVVDAAVTAIRGGGRVHYFGAGTSGRLAVLDAAELLPTFNAPDDMFIAHHAGGPAALIKAAENVEDDTSAGRREAETVQPGDVAIGITASGRTPFVGGALARAREIGATTALLSAHPEPELAASADVLLSVVTGPEALTGSTRLKAGTAQKLVLNGFSTAVMIRLGRTWSNLMVDLVATNAKLRGRVVRILREASGVDEDTAREALEKSEGELKPALLTLLAPDTDAATARDALAANDGSVARALRTLSPPHSSRARSNGSHHQTPEDDPASTDSGDAR